jgi:hypothetical protein
MMVSLTLPFYYCYFNGQFYIRNSLVTPMIRVGIIRIMEGMTTLSLFHV